MYVYYEYIGVRFNLHGLFSFRTPMEYHVHTILETTDIKVMVEISYF
jgi:hypothetical protein